MIFSAFARFLDVRAELLVARMRLVVTDLVAERPKALSPLCESTREFAYVARRRRRDRLVAWVEDTSPSSRRPTSRRCSPRSSPSSKAKRRTAGQHPQLADFLELTRTEASSFSRRARHDRERRQHSDDSRAATP